MIHRSGFALVFSLLLTLALMMLALGVLAVGTREATLAAAMVRKARAEREAEMAAVGVVRRWSTESVRDLPVGGERRETRDDTVSGAAIVRLDSALYLVRGEGRVPGPNGVVVATAGLIVRTLASPADVAPAAVTATGVVTVAGGAVEGWPDSSAAAGAWGVPCGADSAPGIVAPVVTVEADAVVTGVPPIHRGVPPEPPAPDPFAPSLLGEIADTRLSGTTVSPGPTTIGSACVPDRRNWGSPDPTHPCHAALPLVFADGDLTVSGGVGRMTLVVDGDLRITDGAVLYGLIVVRGHLEISGASTIRGAVRARSVEVTDGAVMRDGCAVRSAVTASALDRAFRPPSRWWIPLF